MKKQIILAVSAILLLSSVSAANAVISPNPTDDILLNSSNNYEVKKTFDGSASTPDSITYTWQWIDENQQRSGPEANFTFDRTTLGKNTREDHTVKLIVSSNSDSDSSEVTQSIRDVPNLSISADSTDIDLSDDQSIDFSSSVTNVFSRPDGDKIVNYNWTIDGTHESTSSSFTKTFSETGDYTVKLNVSDEAELFNSTTMSVSVTNSSGNGDGGGSGGGGGGGSGSSEETYDRGFSFGELNQSEEQSLDVDQDGFTSISFKMLNDVTKPYFGINVYETRPEELVGSPTGEDHSFFEIDEENISSEDVEEVMLEFKVENDWIEDRNGSAEDIFLYRYSDENWNRLETRFQDRFNGHHHFEADSPGLSYFGVSLLKHNIFVEKLSIEDDDIEHHELFNLTLTVTNTGSREGQRIIDTEVGDQSYETNVTLANSTTKEYDLKLNLTAGNYTATSMNKSLDFTVSPTPVEESNQSEDQAASTSSSYEIPENQKSNQNSSSAQTDDGSERDLLPILGGLAALIAVLSGAGYYKREEVKDFLEDQGVEIFSEDEMDVPAKYTELRNEIDELNIDKPDINVKMDHARMLLDNGKEERAAEVLREVSERILQDFE